MTVKRKGERAQTEVAVSVLGSKPGCTSKLKCGQLNPPVPPTESLSTHQMNEDPLVVQLEHLDSLLGGDDPFRQNGRGGHLVPFPRPAVLLLQRLGHAREAERVIQAFDDGTTVNLGGEGGVGEHGEGGRAGRA